MPTAKCESCREGIDPEAEKCPHCGEKRMTQERYLLYLIVYLPATALIAGGLLYSLFASSNPNVTFSWAIGIIGILYIAGVYIAREKRKTVRQKIRSSDTSSKTE